MDAPVGDQPLQGQAGDLAAIGIVGGDQDRLRRVVDDEVDAGVQLQGADVAALAADDPALHVVAGQIDHRHRGLDGVVGGQPLDGGGQDFLGLLARGLPRLLLQPHADELRLAAGLVFHLGEQLALGLLGGEAGDRLELAPLLLERGAEPALGLRVAALAVDQALVLVGVLGQPALELLELAGDLFFLGEHPLLDRLDVPLAPAGLVLERRARLQHGFARLQLGRALARFGLALGVLDDPLGVALGGLGDAVGFALGAADASIARRLVEEISDGKREGGDNR